MIYEGRKQIIMSLRTCLLIMAQLVLMALFVGVNSRALADLPESAVPTGQGSDDINPKRTRELLERADKGDWKAARELVNFRVYYKIFDSDTLKAARIWADHDVRGLRSLARVLIQSCLLSHRREAVKKLEAFIADPWFSTLDPVVQGDYLRDLAWIKSRVNDPVRPCVQY
jgi:hypothetical protein